MGKRIKDIYDKALTYEKVFKTREAESSTVRIARGGNLYSSGADDPASSRYKVTPTHIGISFGFRVALYIV